MAPAYVFRMFRTTKVLLWAGQHNPAARRASQDTRGVVALVGARHYGAPSDRTTPLWCSCRASPPAGGGEAAPRLRRAAQQHGRARSRRAGRVVGRRACPLASTLDCSGTPPAPSWCDERQVASSTPPLVLWVAWECGLIPPMGTAGRSPARRGAHAPHPVPARPAARGAAVRGDRGIALPSATSDDGCDCHHASEHSGAPIPSPHDLLHLCLAILIGFAAFFLARVRCRRGTATPGPGSLLAVPGARTRPPVPVARRLAALCVLRC